MHKRSYTPQEYLTLFDMIGNALNDPTYSNYKMEKNVGANKHSSLIDIWNLFNEHEYTICSKLSVETNYKEMYEEMKKTITQHELQILYHEPLKNLPLLISHPNKIVVVFVIFRLKIGK